MEIVFSTWQIEIICFLSSYFHATEILLNELIVLIFARSYYFIVLHMSINWIIVFKFIYAK